MAYSKSLAKYFSLEQENTFLRISVSRSGTVKYITPEVLDGLHDAYNINTKYITHGASNMIDTASLKYENFDEFVDSWGLEQHENKEYLHFTMDANFYDFLVSVYNLKEASIHSNNTTKVADAFYKALEALKENFSTSNKPKKFVLIPADDMIEIADDNISRPKSLNEVVDILNLYAPRE